MVSAIFETIASAITGATQALGSAVTGIVSVFWTPGENGATGSPTFVGILLLIGVAFGLAFLVLNLIRRSVKGMAK